MDIYSDILQTLGLDPSKGGARFLKLLFIWVGVVGLTTVMVFQWSIRNFSPETGKKTSYGEAVSPYSPNVASKTMNRIATGSGELRLMIMGLSADDSKVNHDASNQAKQPVWIYNRGHLTAIPITTCVIGDVPGFRRGWFRVRPWRGRLHTGMEEIRL
jgi:hypothetical protein